MSTGWERKAARGKRWNAADGEAAVSAWRASGESISAFARRHGIDAQRICWWRDRLEDRAEAAALVPVRITSSMGVAVAVRVIAGAHEVEVIEPARTSPEWMAALVRLLG